MQSIIEHVYFSIDSTKKYYGKSVECCHIVTVILCCFIPMIMTSSHYLLVFEYVAIHLYLTYLYVNMISNYCRYLCRYTICYTEYKSYLSPMYRIVP